MIDLLSKPAVRMILIMCFGIGVGLVVTETVDPRIAIPLCAAVLLYGAFRVKKLALALVVLGVLGLFSGLMTGSIWRTLVGAALAITGAGIWLLRSRYGETLPPGDNRPTVSPTEVAAGR